MSISFECIFFIEVLGLGCPFGTNTPANPLFNLEAKVVKFAKQSTHYIAKTIYSQFIL